MAYNSLISSYKAHDHMTRWRDHANYHFEQSDNPYQYK